MDRKSRIILIILFSGVLMGALDISIVGPVIPSIESALHVEPRKLGWIFSIYVLFNLTGISLFARLSDIFGRRSIYVVSLLLFGSGSLIVSLSDNYTILLIGRGVQGFGASGIFPVASAVVGDIFPKEKRGRVLGLIGAVFGLAFLIGPLIAGILLKYFNWSALFLINLPIAVILIIASLRYLPQNKFETKGLFDWKGIVSLGIMLASFTYGINKIESDNFYQSLISSDVLPYLIVALVFLILTFFIERSAENPVLKIIYLKNRQIIVAGTIAVATGILQASFVFIPNYIVGLFSVSSSEASFMLIPLVLATAIGSPVFGRIIDAVGSKIVILIALIMASAGFYLLHIVDYKILFYISGALIGFGLSVLSGSSLRYIMLNETAAIDRAVTQGMLTIFTSLGQLTGAALIGVIIAQTRGIEGYKNVFLYQSILLILIFLSAFLLKNKQSEIQETKFPD